MKVARHLLTIAAVSLLIAAAALGVYAKKMPPGAQWYPCTSCHTPYFKVNAHVKISLVHHIDLTKGAHRGLYCSDCHIPPTMINLVGGGKVYIPGLHNRTQLIEASKVCAVCHPREWSDWEHLIHGNKTYTCPGGTVVYITPPYSYKGVRYPFHICPNHYKDLKTIPAKACVQCHNPHDPVYRPLGPLPVPSLRPPPPNEDNFLYGMIATVIAGVILIGLALVYPFGGRSHA